MTEKMEKPDVRSIGASAGDHDGTLINAENINANAEVQEHRQPSDEMPKKSWRDVIKVHPAADKFPMMDRAELIELGEDILKNGLLSPIALYQDGIISEAQDLSKWSLLDGRNRLDALEAVGLTITIEMYKRPRTRRYLWPRITIEGEALKRNFGVILRHGGADGRTWAWISVSDDPYAYALSANIKRRHLKADERRRIVEDLIKANPEKSNRQIAEETNVPRRTVDNVRNKLVATGQVAQLDKIVGKDGKSRTTKPKTKAERTLTEERRQKVIDTLRPDRSAEDVASLLNNTVTVAQVKEAMADEKAAKAVDGTAPKAASNDPTLAQVAKIKQLICGNDEIVVELRRSSEEARKIISAWVADGALDDDGVAAWASSLMSTSMILPT